MSAPFCVKCGIVKPYRVLILICSFTGSALLWWALNLSTWVKIDNSHQSFFSALFAICSGEIKCWALPSKSNYYIFGQIFMISALLLSFFLSFILLAFPHSLPDTRKQYFIFTTTFFIIGICVFLALLLHYLYILKTTSLYKDMKITFLYPSFLLIFSTILFFLSGILCLCSTHRWLHRVLVQPIQVKPMQISVDNGNSVTEGIPGRDG